MTKKFGKHVREQFLFADGYLPLNHGSFGTYPRVIRDALRRYQDAAEAAPDGFIRYDYPRLLDKSREAIAGVVNAPVDEVVFMSNATTGINTVLRSLTFDPGDQILYFNTTYGACGKTVEYICETTPAEAIRVDLNYPLEDSGVVQYLRDAVTDARTRGGRVRVALLDTVISMPGLCMPIADLVKVCKDERVLSLVDGAHGIGHIDLDLKKLDADFFVSNCHKWLFVPRGCAVFHVPERNQHLIRSTLPTSHGWRPAPDNLKAGGIYNVLGKEKGKSDFVNEFQFIGTLDNSPYLCIPDAIRFRQEACGGEDAIRQYCFDLARQAGETVAKALGTGVLENSGKTLGQCNFANVRLPFKISADEKEVGTDTIVTPEHAATVVLWMQRTISDEHDAFIAVLAHNGFLWARLSAQIYLDISDFERGADILKEVSRRAAQGEYLEREQFIAEQEKKPVVSKLEQNPG